MLAHFYWATKQSERIRAQPSNSAPNFQIKFPASLATVELGPRLGAQQVAKHGGAPLCFAVIQFERRGGAGALTNWTNWKSERHSLAGGRRRFVGGQLIRSRD